MSLKSLINALFKLSGGQAMPDSREIQVTSKTGTNTFIPPANGYLVLGASQSGNQYGYVNIWGGINASSTTGTSSSSAFPQARAYVPCKKGKTVSYSMEGTIDRSAFVYLVGGVINRLLSQVTDCFAKEVCHA